MATLTTNIFVDGPRNTVMKADVLCDDGDLPLQTLVDMASLPGKMNNQLTVYKKCRLDHIEYDIEDGLAVYLWWEGSLNNSILWRLAGRGRVPAAHYGGIQNTAVEPTGNILISTQGWTVLLGELSASMIIKLVKQQ